jgi:hypothetical protein
MSGNPIVKMRKQQAVADGHLARLAQSTQGKADQRLKDHGRALRESVGELCRLPVVPAGKVEELILYRLPSLREVHPRLTRRPK